MTINVEKVKPISWISNQPEVHYPESDGEPMAETDTHRDLMTKALIHPLQQYFKGRDDVYISGNLLLYYEEGNPKKSVAPDVFVVIGLPNHQRRIYKLWEEGCPPDVVFELTSKSTYKVDLNKKKHLYEQLGVQEYFLFDPLKDRLNPSLQGFRLHHGNYIPIAIQQLGNGEWQAESYVLSLNLRTNGDKLDLYDLKTNRYLLTSDEEAEAREREAIGRRLAERQVAYEVKAREVAEQKANKEAEARRLAEKKVAEEAEARRHAEQKAAEAEAELARLKALLKIQENKKS